MAEHNAISSYAPQKREELFEEIVTLYDLADDVLASLAEEDATHRNEQLELVKPFVMQVTNATNSLSALYTDAVRNGKAVTPELPAAFEGELQTIFYAYRDLLEGVKHKFLPES